MTAIATAPSLVVLIPVYRDQRGLESSLDSLLEARLPPVVRTLVVDDGSEPAVALDGQRYAKLGLQLERLPENRGIEHALNRGIEIARGLGAKYLARLDAGDTVDPMRFAKQIDCLERQASLGLVASDALFVDPEGRVLFRFAPPRGDREIRRGMHINCCLLHPTVTLRVSVLEHAGAYSSRYPAAEDYDLFFRVLHFARATSIPEPLTTIVATPHGISARRRRAQLASRLRIQSRYFDARCLESYFGIALTLAFFFVPQALVARMKRFAGASRY